MELKQLTDPELHVRLKALAAQERESVADIVEHLAELERRDTVTDTGCGTLFDYCRRVLGYSEAAAFLRIRAARAALVSHRVVEDLRSGAVHLDAVMRLAPHMNEDNGEKLLDLASGATKREVQALVAGLGGETPLVERDHVRIVKVAPLRDTPTIIPPPSRVRLAFTADDDFLKMVERLRSLRRHRFRKAASKTSSKKRSPRGSPSSHPLQSVKLSSAPRMREREVVAFLRTSGRLSGNETVAGASTPLLMGRAAALRISFSSTTSCPGRLEEPPLHPIYAFSVARII